MNIEWNLITSWISQDIGRVYDLNLDKMPEKVP